MIRIVTDSTCYLPPEFVAKHSILVVPLKVQLGNETFAETRISNDDFYRRLITTNELLVGAHVGPGTLGVGFCPELAERRFPWKGANDN